MIGRRLLPKLITAGHRVTGMTRSSTRAAGIRAVGAEAVVVDVFDRDAVAEAVSSARPQVVVHELTSLPKAIDPRRVDVDLAENSRIRREGTRNLVDASVKAGASRIVAQSVAFATAPAGPKVLDETAPLYLDAPPKFRETILSAGDLEDAVLGAPIEGVVLRYGFFYGPGSAFARDGANVDAVRARRLPILGGGAGVWSFVHAEDAADATLLALDRGRPGIYNVTDDEPAAARDWIPVYAEALAAPSPLHVPLWLGRPAAGPYGAFLMTELRGASNAKAKAVFGWTPEHPSWRTGFAEDLRDADPPER